MSKESKPRDRWRQLHAAAASRPGDYCPGCGYYGVANNEHRADCTAPRDETRDETAPEGNHTGITPKAAQRGAQPQHGALGGDA